MITYSLVANFLVETISNGSCCRLVDDTQNVKTRDGASIFSGLSLGVIKVGWDCDDGIVNSLQSITQIRSYIYIYYTSHSKVKVKCYQIIPCQGMPLQFLSFY